MKSYQKIQMIYICIHNIYQSFYPAIIMHCVSITKLIYSVYNMSISRYPTLSITTRS